MPGHCHNLNVKHGDVKSNNIKFNVHSGNYVLLDFGLAIMSDEQRRTSLRRAGAVEFMAPEQNDGHMLFETDVYSFGVVIFELLAGRVPFPLAEKGETSRNIVRLSHMETPAPDVLLLRTENLPTVWSEKKRELEMHVPEWLTSMVYKCLEKEPEKRFGNGKELHEFIVHHGTHGLPYIMQDQVQKINAVAVTPDFTEQDIEKETLQKQLSDYKRELEIRNTEFAELKKKLDNQSVHENVDDASGYNELYEPVTKSSSVPKKTFLTLLFVTVGLAALCAFLYFKQPTNPNTLVSSIVQDTIPQIDSSAAGIDTTGTSNIPVSVTGIQVKDTNKNKLKPKVLKRVDTAAKYTATANEGATTDEQNADEEEQEPVDKTNYTGRRFKPVSVAYFYTKPDQSTLRRQNINRWNEPVTALADKNGYIYVSYTNEDGVTTKGWLRKKDLNRLED